MNRLVHDVPIESVFVDGFEWLVEYLSHTLSFMMYAFNELKCRSFKQCVDTVSARNMLLKQ
jgi:hypothetical protein